MKIESLESGKFTEENVLAFTNPFWVRTGLFWVCSGLFWVYTGFYFGHPIFTSKNLFKYLNQ